MAVVGGDESSVLLGVGPSGGLVACPGPFGIDCVVVWRPWYTFMCWAIVLLAGDLHVGPTQLVVILPSLFVLSYLAGWFDVWRR